MPQVWKVAKAFQSTNRDTNEPDVVKTQGGDMHKYMVQVEGQPINGWLQILKKPGNAVKQGDELYGDIVENNWGKPQFNRAQRPQEGYNGGTPAAQAAQPAPSNGGSVEQKLDYIISLLENRGNFQQDDAPANTTSPASSTVDDDNMPADLTKLGY